MPRTESGQCTFCGLQTENPCLNPRDTEECSDFNANPHPGEDIHASKEQPEDDR